MNEAGKYVHGYSERESVRLSDQACTLSALLHCDIFYPPGSRVLEAGCGVGSQTIVLARNNPHVSFVSVDLCQDSLDKAKTFIEQRNIANVTFRRADIFNLPFENGYFDHVFVCFILEHLPNPLDALTSLKAVLKSGGTITVIEGDHGSAYFHPQSQYARRAIQCLIDLQSLAGGDSLIGRRLYPLLVKAGFKNVKVGPMAVYADAGKPEMVKGFTLNTFTAMVEGVEQKVLDTKMMTPEDWRRGIEDLYRTAQPPDGTFNYTFFKAQGTK